MNTLEDKLLEDFNNGKAVSAEEALLIVSGVETPEELESYKEKLGQIDSRFRKWLKSKGAIGGLIDKDYMTLDRARYLFEYLWLSKPKRHGSGYSLTSAIHRQLDSDINRTVGSCVGLTALFTVLCMRENITVFVLASDDHVLNRVKCGGVSVNVENTDPDGFDKKLDDNSYYELSPSLLAAAILDSRGIEQEKEGKLEGALDSFTRAIAIRQDYANAYNNRGNVYFKIGEYERARKDYENALRLCPSFAEACCNLGLALERQQKLNDAIYFFEKTLEISPQYEDARRCLEIVAKRRTAV